LANHRPEEHKNSLGQGEGWSKKACKPKKINAEERVMKEGKVSTGRRLEKKKPGFLKGPSKLNSKQTDGVRKDWGRGGKNKMCIRGERLDNEGIRTRSQQGSTPTQKGKSMGGTRRE